MQASESVPEARPSGHLGGHEKEGFCHITGNWRGRSLLGHRVIVNLIAHTRTPVSRESVPAGSWSASSGRHRKGFLRGNGARKYSRTSKVILSSFVPPLRRFVAFLPFVPLLTPSLPPRPGGPVDEGELVGRAMRLGGLELGLHPTLEPRRVRDVGRVEEEFRARPGPSSGRR